MQCPRCHGPLDTSGATAACHACRGRWIGRAALADMIAEMKPGEMRPGETPSLPLEPRQRDEPALPCPRCERPMAAAGLAGVAVDDCEEHGIWFDADELAEVLRQSHQAPAAELSWLDRLLRN